MGCYHFTGIFPKGFYGGEFDNDYTITEWLTQYSENKDVTYVRGFPRTYALLPEKMVSRKSESTLRW